MKVSILKEKRKPTDPQKELRKMPIFKCSCGIRILIFPDLPEMVATIKSHLIEHNKVTGQHLSEKLLAQEILKELSKTNDAKQNIASKMFLRS